MPGTGELVFAGLMLIAYLAAAGFLIMNPESAAEYAGWVRRFRSDLPTPGWLVRGFGCCMVGALPGVIAGVMWSVPIGCAVGAVTAALLYCLALRFFGPAMS